MTVQESALRRVQWAGCQAFLSLAEAPLDLDKEQPVSRPHDSVCAMGAGGGPELTEIPSFPGSGIGDSTFQTVFYK